MLLLAFSFVFSSLDSFDTSCSDDLDPSTTIPGLSTTQSPATDSWLNPDLSDVVVSEDSDSWSDVTLAVVVVSSVAIFAAIIAIIVFLLHRKSRHEDRKGSWQDPMHYVVDSELFDDLARG